MKKFLFSIAMMAMALTASAQQELTVTAEASEVDGGESTLVINLANTESFVGWQAYLDLPKGITVNYEIEQEEDEETGEINDIYYYDLTLSKRHSRAFTSSGKPTETGIMIVVFNLNQSAVKENEGELCTINLQVSSEYDGTSPITIRDFAVSAKDGAQTNAEGVVEVIPGVSTGINAVNFDDADAVIYNVAGQKVNKAAKGLYIKNGKKVVVK